MYFIGNAVTWRTLALFGIDFSQHKFNQKLNSERINSIQIDFIFRCHSISSTTCGIILYSGVSQMVGEKYYLYDFWIV